MLSFNDFVLFKQLITILLLMLTSL